MKGSMTREQVAVVVGISAVELLDYIACEPTGRCGYNGACQGDELCEWVASIDAVDADGENCELRAYYYTTNDQDENPDSIDWVIEGYEIA